MIGSMSDSSYRRISTFALTACNLAPSDALARFLLRARRAGRAGGAEADGRARATVAREDGGKVRRDRRGRGRPRRDPARDRDAAGRAGWPGPEREIRLLVDHRDDLVADGSGVASKAAPLAPARTRPATRRPLGALDRAVWLDQLARQLARREQTAQVRIARDLLARCHLDTFDRRARSRATEAHPDARTQVARVGRLRPTQRGEAVGRDRPDRPLRIRRPSSPATPASPRWTPAPANTNATA